MTEASVQIASGATPLLLVFYPDNPCSTKLYESSTNQLQYIVHTDVLRQEGSSKKSTVTTVKRGTGETIAQFDWKDMFSSDIVSLTPAIAGSSEEGTELVTMSSNNWLKRSMIPFKESVTYKNPNRKGYKWKGFGPGLSLELHTPDNSEAVVKFHSSNSISLTRTASTGSQSGRSNGRDRARLIIDGSLVSGGLVDEIVVAFLYLEKLRRTRDDDGFNPA